MEQSIEAQKKISADIETKIAELEQQIQDDGKFVDIGENRILSQAKCPILWAPYHTDLMYYYLL